MKIPHPTSTVATGVGTPPPPKTNVIAPKAVGLIRADISGLNAPRHAIEIRRHAEQLGYRYLYTVRPPDNRDVDPVKYALKIAVGVQAAALVVHDLATVGNTPARVCDVCDLETVIPATTWAAVSPSLADPAHTYPGHPLTVVESHRIMQQHRACRAVICPRKASAFGYLVRAGKIVPAAATPRERAAARGLSFPVSGNNHSLWGGPDLPTLLDVLQALTNPDCTTSTPAAHLQNRIYPGGLD